VKERGFKNRAQWRAWLEKHHASESGIWLVYFKKHTGKPTVVYEEAVQEALCFGWIDSLVKRIDDRRYKQKYTPRRAKSTWSPANKKRVALLVDGGLMTPAGQAKIEAAKRDGSWNSLDELYRDDTVPEELHAALAENDTARRNFEKLAPSHLRQYLAWLQSAKRPATREKRIGEIVARVAANRKPGI